MTMTEQREYKHVDANVFRHFLMNCATGNISHAKMSVMSMTNNGLSIDTVIIMLFV